MSISKHAEQRKKILEAAKRQAQWDRSVADQAWNCLIWVQPDSKGEFSGSVFFPTSANTAELRESFLQSVVDYIIGKGLNARSLGNGILAISWKD